MVRVTVRVRAGLVVGLG